MSILIKETSSSFIPSSAISNDKLIEIEIPTIGSR